LRRRAAASRCNCVGNLVVDTALVSAAICQRPEWALARRESAFSLRMVSMMDHGNTWSSAGFPLATNAVDQTGRRRNLQGKMAEACSDRRLRAALHGDEACADGFRVRRGLEATAMTHGFMIVVVPPRLGRLALASTAGSPVAIKSSSTPAADALPPPLLERGRPRRRPSFGPHDTLWMGAGFGRIRWLSHGETRIWEDWQGPGANRPQTLSR
jgi:hypothetical protein